MIPGVKETRESFKPKLQKQLHVTSVKLGLPAGENMTEEGGHKKQLNRLVKWREQARRWRAQTQSQDTAKQGNKRERQARATETADDRDVRLSRRREHDRGRNN